MSKCKPILDMVKITKIKVRVKKNIPKKQKEEEDS